MKRGWIIFHVPDDEKMLAALGEITLRHEHLTHVLKMTIKSVVPLSVEDALDSTHRLGAAVIRKRIKNEARRILGEGESYYKLEALLERSRRLSDRRNHLVHGLWAKPSDGDPGVIGALGQIEQLPSIGELKELSDEIESLSSELNKARLKGFIRDALVEKHKS